MQRLFEEESLGYEFREGLVQKAGQTPHGKPRSTRRKGALADLRLGAAQKHFSKALRHFRNRERPDYENTVKEAVCAVEAAAKELFPLMRRAATLGDFVKWAISR